MDWTSAAAAIINTGPRENFILRAFYIFLSCVARRPLQRFSCDLTIAGIYVMCSARKFRRETASI